MVETLSENEVKRCSRCVMPSGWAGIKFDDAGVCNLCHAHDTYTNDIDWGQREKVLIKLLEYYRAVAYAADNKYDCIIPSSGGKDSTWALYTAKVTYGMTPLVVTWNHGLWMSPEALYNLYDIPAMLDCDHLDFRLGNNLRNGIARKGTEFGGDFCAFCHLGVGAFPARIAKQWNIPLIIYGEPTALYSTTGTYTIDDVEEQDRNHFEDVFQGIYKVENVLPDNYVTRDMMPMMWPEGEFSMKAIYLGNFIRWDQWRHVDILTKELGWNKIETPITYTGWDKVDCERGECLRELQKFHRRGVSRVAFQASKDIRDGRMTRDEAMKLVEKYESKIYSLDLDGVLEELGFESKEEFLNITHEV